MYRRLKTECVQEGWMVASERHAALGIFICGDLCHAHHCASEDCVHLCALEDHHLEGSDVHAQHMAVREMHAHSTHMHIII